MVCTWNNDFHDTFHDDSNNLVAKFLQEPKYRPVYLRRAGI